MVVTEGSLNSQNKHTSFVLQNVSQEKMDCPKRKLLMYKQNPDISLITSLSAKAEEATELRDVSGTHHISLRHPR